MYMKNKLHVAYLPMGTKLHLSFNIVALYMYICIMECTVGTKVKAHTLYIYTCSYKRTYDFCQVNTVCNHHVHQDTQSCVSGQESRVTHKCVIYRNH